jgi:hypothetical protein
VRGGGRRGRCGGQPPVSQCAPERRCPRRLVPSRGTGGGVGGGCGAMLRLGGGSG